MNYELLTGTTKYLPEKVKDYLVKGYKVCGGTFRTGNRILVSGDLAYPITCEYTAEIAQAVIKE